MSISARSFDPIVKYVPIAMIWQKDTFCEPVHRLKPSRGALRELRGKPGV